MTLGACLKAVLREHGYQVAIVETYAGFSEIVQDRTSMKFDLVIATNTSFPPAHLQIIIPDIKARHPHVRIIVLSGFYLADFVADLEQKGVDKFLSLPFQEDTLLTEVAGLLSKPTL